MVVEELTGAGEQRLAQGQVQVVGGAGRARGNRQRRQRGGGHHFAIAGGIGHGIEEADRTAGNGEGLDRQLVCGRDDAGGRRHVTARRRHDFNAIGAPRRAGRVAEIQVELVVARGQRHLVLLPRVSEARARQRRVGRRVQ